MDRLLRIVPPPPPEPADAQQHAQGQAQEQAADAALVAALRAREARAMPALIDRYGGHVRRVLLRVLGGNDSEFADVFQDVITNAWQGIDDLSNPHALKAWLTQIAIFTARGTIRRRQRRRWLTFFDRVPEPDVTWAGPDLQEAAGCVYQIFERMPVDERIPFALRMLEGLDLEATAAACGMSMATIRRRLVRAERRFFKLARQCEALLPWLEAQ